MKNKANVLMVCERSAGHIFPALAIGRKLSKELSFQEPKCQSDIYGRRLSKVYFFVTSSFLKAYVESEGYPVVGKSLGFRNLIIEGIWRFFEAVYIILKVKPKRIIGFGGRDSFFLVLLSSFLFLETAIYEPNLKMGKANKLLSLFVNKVFRGFQEETENKKDRVINIPMRENIKKVDEVKARKYLNFNDKPVVLCFGGSQGASFINTAFMKFIRHVQDCQVIHLTGKNDYLEICQLYNKMKNNKFVKDFYYKMEILYSVADIVVARAGATTLGEISFYNLPSVLIPHPWAGGHQKDNALYFKEKGAAFVYPQDDFVFEQFSDSLKELIYNPGLRQNMRDNVSKISLGISFEEVCLI